MTPYASDTFNNGFDNISSFITIIFIYQHIQKEFINTIMLFN